MDDKNNKGSKGKLAAIIIAIIIVGGLILFFVMGAIKKSQGGPGQRPDRKSVV